MSIEDRVHGLEQRTRAPEARLAELEGGECRRPRPSAILRSRVARHHATRPRRPPRPPRRSVAPPALHAPSPSRPRQPGRLAEPRGLRSAAACSPGSAALAVLAGLRFLLIDRDLARLDRRGARARLLAGAALARACWPLGVRLRERRGQHRQRARGRRRRASPGCSARSSSPATSTTLVPAAARRSRCAFAIGAVRHRARRSAGARRAMGWLGLLGALWRRRCWSALERRRGMVFLALAFAATVAVLVWQRWTALGVSRLRRRHAAVGGLAASATTLERAARSLVALLAFGGLERQSPRSGSSCAPARRRSHSPARRPARAQRAGPGVDGWRARRRRRRRRAVARRPRRRAPRRSRLAGSACPADLARARARRRSALGIVLADIAFAALVDGAAAGRSAGPPCAVGIGRARQTATHRVDAERRARRPSAASSASRSATCSATTRRWQQLADAGPGRRAVAVALVAGGCFAAARSPARRSRPLARIGLDGDSRSPLVAYFAVPRARRRRALTAALAGRGARAGRRSPAATRRPARRVRRRVGFARRAQPAPRARRRSRRRTRSLDGLDAAARRARRAARRRRRARSRGRARRRGRRPACALARGRAPRSPSLYLASSVEVVTARRAGAARPDAAQRAVGARRRRRR